MYLNVSKNIKYKYNLFIVYHIYFNDIKLLILLLSNVFAISLFLYFYTSKDRMPDYPIFFCFYNLFISLIWIWVSVNILIDLLIAISQIMNIPNSFFGITLLSYGNSLPDLLFNLSLVKLGYGEMILSYSIEGILFIFLIGLGLPFTILNLRKGTIKIDFFNKNNKISIACLAFLVLNLFILGIESKLANYHLNTKFAIKKVVFYAIFFILILIFIFFIR